MRRNVPRTYDIPLDRPARKSRPAIDWSTSGRSPPMATSQVAGVNRASGFRVWRVYCVGEMLPIWAVQSAKRQVVKVRIDDRSIEA
jgi:hypothetical protein